MCLSEIDCEVRFNFYSQEWKMQQRQRRGIKIQISLFFMAGRKNKMDQRGKMETAEEL